MRWLWLIKLTFQYFCVSVRRLKGISSIPECNNPLEFLPRKMALRSQVLFKDIVHQRDLTEVETRVK
jgi:hypothetical protein